MAKPPLGTSTYGHFERALFDTQSQDWKFGRDTTRKATIGNVVDPRLVLPSQNEQPPLDRKVKCRLVPSRRRQSQAEALIQSYPELQPARSLLPDAALCSQATEAVSAQHDTQQGDLLAFGSIPGNGPHDPLKVLAVASGPTRSDIRFTRVPTGDPAKSAPGEIGLLVGIDTVEGELWRGPGAPILAIAFSESTEGSDVILAVRLSGLTLILRPTMAGSDEGRKAIIKMKLMLSLTSDTPGNSPIVDIAFNPDMHKQFATIDQVGTWSVRGLVGRRSTYTTTNLREGLLSEPELDAGQHTPGDGWAKLVWLGTTSLLALCKRRTLVILDSNTETTYDVTEQSSILIAKMDVILDIAPVPTPNAGLVILTNVSIAVYRLRQEDGHDFAPTCIARVLHFRGNEDITLRMCVCSIEGGIMIALRSDLNTTITAHALIISDPARILFADPVEIVIPRPPRATLVSGAIAGLHIESLPPAAATNPRRRHDSFLCTLLRKDGSLMQTLYVDKIQPGANAGHASMPQTGSHKPQALSDLAPLYRRNSGDLILDFEPMSSYARQVNSGSLTRSTSGWTISLRLVYQRIAAIEGRSVCDVADIVNEARQALEHNAPDEAPLVALLELTDREITALNLRSANESFLDLEKVRADSQSVVAHDSSMVGNALRLVLGEVNWPFEIGRTSPLREDRLRPLYNAILENWVKSLSNGLQQDVIEMREHLALRVAVQVALAGLVVRSEDHREQREEPRSQIEGKAPGENNDFKLPLRAFQAQSIPQLAPRDTVVSSSQPLPSGLPTPSRSATPATVGSTSQRSTHPAPEIARLASYTSFSQPAPSALPRSLNRVLSQWNVGGDPAKYEWQSISQRFTQQNEEAEEGELDEKEVKRRQRAAARYERRLERERVESRRLHMLSSQAPEVAAGSQATQHTEAQGFSQSTAATASQQPMTQVVAGRYGARQPARKKRRSGF